MHHERVVTESDFVLNPIHFLDYHDLFESKWLLSIIRWPVTNQR